MEEIGLSYDSSRLLQQAPLGNTIPVLVVWGGWALARSMHCMQGGATKTGLQIPFFFFWAIGREDSVAPSFSGDISKPTWPFHLSHAKKFVIYLANV